MDTANFQICQDFRSTGIRHICLFLKSKKQLYTQFKCHMFAQIRPWDALCTVSVTRVGARCVCVTQSQCLTWNHETSPAGWRANTGVTAVNHRGWRDEGCLNKALLQDTLHLNSSPPCLLLLLQRSRNTNGAYRLVRGRESVTHRVMFHRKAKTAQHWRHRGAKTDAKLLENELIHTQKNQHI